jgi:hypothetical protein
MSRSHGLLAISFDASMEVDDKIAAFEATDEMIA